MKRSLTISVMLLGLFLVWQGFSGTAVEAKQPLSSPSLDPTAASSLVADYQFRDSLSSSVSNAPALTNLGSNSFDNATIDDSTRRALSFEPNNGVALAPTTGLLTSQSYSIVLLFSLASTSGYRRLIDFKNGTADGGLYCDSGGLGFKRDNNSGFFSGSRVILQNNFLQLVMTRSAEGDVNVYANGVRQLSFLDTGSDATIGANNALRFFRDNNGEASAGLVARIRVYNAALSGGEIAGLDRLPNAQASCPSPSGFVQNSGGPGVSFLLNGVGFGGVSAVRFPNNLGAAFTINDDTQISLTVPVGAVTGTLTLAKPNCGEVQTNAVFNVPGSSLPTSVADYQFQGTLGSATGFPPALLSLGAGGFENVEVDNRLRRALKFDSNNGVAVFSTAGLISNQSYTVAVLFSIANTSGYRRLLDFKNGTRDGGLYCDSGGFGFKRDNNSGFFSSNRVINPNNFVQLVMTRNAAGNVAVYLNGVNQLSFVDSGSDALIEGNALRFFRDNTNDGEASSGFVARIRLYNTALSSNEVAALDRLPTGSVATVSAASFSGSTLASESIVAAFGSDLATATQVAATVPLPTQLAGTTVKIKDNLGIERLAPLFFVAPTQVNYQVPQGVIPGVALVTITSGNGAASAGTLQIASVAPGLFTANASGQGVVTGLALRVKADGAQSFEPLARFDAGQGQFVPVPVDLGPVTDQVFLILYGTGWRGRSGLPAVGMKIGGVDAEVLYAGSQGDFVGLDQLNVRLPRSLGGRGEVDIGLLVDGNAANIAKINIR